MVLHETRFDKLGDMQNLDLQLELLFWNWLGFKENGLLEVLSLLELAIQAAIVLWSSWWLELMKWSSTEADWTGTKKWRVVVILGSQSTVYIYIYLWGGEWSTMPRTRNFLVTTKYLCNWISKIQRMTFDMTTLLIIVVLDFYCGLKSNLLSLVAPMFAEHSIMFMSSTSSWVS